MLAARICFVAAAILGLNACARGSHTAPPPAFSTATNASPALAPPAEPIVEPIVEPQIPVEAKARDPLPQPVTPEPAARPVTPAATQPAPAAPPRLDVTTPAPKAATKIAPPVAKAPVPPEPIARAPQPVAPPPPDAALTLDLNALKKQLKDTKAIGIFSKIALKNQVDDLLKQFRDFYSGKGKNKVTMTDLRQSYNLLMLKVLSLVQDEDQKLAAAIVSSREAIWDLLADPKKFATLQV